MLKENMKKFAEFLAKVISKILITLIKFYQYFISPFLPKSCKFQPTCSEYAIIALSKYKLKGIMMTIKRVIKCSSISSGGYDPVDNNRTNSQK